MNGDPEDVAPAEEQLLALLELLRDEGLEPAEALTDAVMRTVEWQLFIRGTVLLIGDLVGSMAAVVALLLSSPSPPEDTG
jgi:hypothetical protein